ncbi:MAG: VOC family protein [Candidatus Binatia bacterium]
MAKKKTAKRVGKKRKAAKRATKKRVAAVPAGSHTVTPYLVVSDALAAIDFYQRAFGAKLRYQMTMAGKIGHAEMKVGDSQIFLADEFPGSDQKAPTAGSAASVSLHLYFKDVKKAFDRAVTAGAQVTMPLTDMFWGDRFGKIADPFGHQWSMAQHIEDVSPKEMTKRAAAAMPPPPAA